ncbi:hypothetical protein LLG95_10855 [bacterium]|nr:hypothetical protein [bacterium]
MKRLLLQAVGLGALMALALGASSCVVSTPPAGAEGVVYYDDAHPGPLHEYYYYPNSQLYFDPSIRIWYWHEDGHWSHGRDLPARYQNKHRDRYIFRSDVREPYVIHDKIERNYRDRTFGHSRNRPELDYNRRYDRYPERVPEYDRYRPIPPVGEHRR